MKQILKFLNLLDHEGGLSITNLAVIVVLIKLAVAPAATLTEAGALLISLGNYMHKRSVNKDSATQPEEPDTITPQVEEMQTKLDEVTSQVSALSMQSGIKKMN